MIDLFKYVVETFGWFGGISFVIYFLVSKIPSFMDGLTQLTERRVQRLEKLVENPHLPVSVKEITENILRDEYVFRATGYRISEFMANEINKICNATDRRVQINDLMVSEYISFNTKEGLFEFKDVTPKNKDSVKKRAWLYLWTTLIIFLVPIVIILLIYIFPFLAKLIISFFSGYKLLINLDSLPLVIGIIIAITGNVAVESFSSFFRLSKALRNKEIFDAKKIPYISNDKNVIRINYH